MYWRMRKLIALLNDHIDERRPLHEVRAFLIEIDDETEGRLFE